MVEKPKQEKIKQPQKQKGVSAEPHPLDRRSGTGIGELSIEIYIFEGKEPKKQGGGGHNWGNYKDELKMEDNADKHDLFKVALYFVVIVTKGHAQEIRQRRGGETIENTR